MLFACVNRYNLLMKKPIFVNGIALIFFFFTLTSCDITSSHTIPLDQQLNPSSIPFSDIPSSANFSFITPSPAGPVRPISTATIIQPSRPPTPSEPLGCQEPVENYDIVNINGYLLNRRTYEMLLHANELYGGVLDITGSGITQGSYSNTESASFGTHNGGGALDLSVMYPGTYTVAYDEIGPLILALRTAGFAAWLRNFDELYPGSPIHIHAIAVGDRQLSPAALDQLTGKSGYFNGFNGLPRPDDAPVPDPHEGPLICNWMRDFIATAADDGRVE